MQQNMELRNKIFININIILIFVSTACILGNFLTHYPMIANLKWGYLIILSFLSLIFRDKSLALFLQVFYALNIILIILPSGWIYAGKGNSNSTAYLFLIMIGITLLFQNKLRAILLLVLAATVASLFYLEYAYPDLIVTYSDNLLFYDRLIQIPLTLIAGYLLLRQFANTYIEEKNKLNLYSKQLQEANSKLEYLAHIDSLTNIYNRRSFDIRLGEIIGGMEQFHNDIYVILFDVDLFKNINDTFGHSAGDKVLKEIAKSFRLSLSEKDHFSRWGGDEFAIIYNGSNDEVLNYIGTMNELLEKINIEENYQVTLSIGITKILATDTMNKVFKRVDDGLYKSKTNGRNQHTFV